MTALHCRWVASDWKPKTWLCWHLVVWNRFAAQCCVRWAPCLQVDKNTLCKEVVQTCNVALNCIFLNPINSKKILIYAHPFKVSFPYYITNYSYLWAVDLALYFLIRCSLKGKRNQKPSDCPFRAQDDAAWKFWLDYKNTVFTVPSKETPWPGFTASSFSCSFFMQLAVWINKEEQCNIDFTSHVEFFPRKSAAGSLNIADHHCKMATDSCS